MSGETEYLLIGVLNLKSLFGMFPAFARPLPDPPIVREETFAPILYLIPSHTLDEAVTIEGHPVSDGR